ncbi:hypothetical protein CBA19C6_14345 [Cupriavidus pauculus]|nr:hypothetical protein CBA19C6_14345 [Cupriavidus pauculus]
MTEACGVEGLRQGLATAAAECARLPVDPRDERRGALEWLTAMKTIGGRI